MWFRLVPPELWACSKSGAAGILHMHIHRNPAQQIPTIHCTRIPVYIIVKTTLYLYYSLIQFLKIIFKHR